MPVRKKNRFAAAFLVALAISTSSFAQAAPARVQVAYVAISGTQGALWVAKETGLFRKYGLETNLMIYIAGASRVIQATWRYATDTLERIPHPDPESFKVVLEDRVSGRPDATKARPEQFIDGSLIGELEREGFFKRIYTR